MDQLLEMRNPDVLAVAGVIGGVTARHRDLDIVVDHNPRELDAVIAALASLGLHHLSERHTPRSVTPRRVWLGDGTGHNVDLLPVDIDDSPFRAAEGAPAAFTTGVVAGAQIPCLSAAFQIEHHRMHRPRSTDRHDLRLLTSGGVVR